MAPEPLYYQGLPKLGLVGHLFRESLIAARAIVGEAISLVGDRRRRRPGPPLPLDDEDTYRKLRAARQRQGGDRARAGHRRQRRSWSRTASARWSRRSASSPTCGSSDHDALFRATLAALDTASFRVDPWLTGLAERRLQAHDHRRRAVPARARTGGWTRRRPPRRPAPSRPGPTAAGLLHAPSRDQALTAALLRDAAVRHPDDGRWDLTIDSAKVRAVDRAGRAGAARRPPVRGAGPGGGEGGRRLGCGPGAAGELPPGAGPGGASGLRRGRGARRRPSRDARRRAPGRPGRAGWRRWTTCSTPMPTCSWPTACTPW